MSPLPAFLLTPSGISLWFYNITTAESRALLAEHEPPLGEIAATPMRAFSYVMRRAILAQVTGVPIEQLTFYNTTYGKPSLFHSDIGFSISHTGPYWCMGVCQGKEIGVDIERLRRRQREEAILKNYFHPDEYAAYQAESCAERRTELFFRLWTAKEAVAKLQGKGLAHMVHTESLLSNTTIQNEMIQCSESQEKLMLALAW